VADASKKLRSKVSRHHTKTSSSNSTKATFANSFFNEKRTVLGNSVENKGSKRYIITLLPKKNLNKFSSKRFKKSHKSLAAIKTNYYINFTNLTKKNLNKFLFNLNNTALKNKYKTLIRKYYFLLSNNKLNTINNKNYFLNYVNLAKTKSSVNTDKNNYTSNLCESVKNTFFTTRRNNNYYKLFDNNKVKKSVAAFESIFALNNVRKPRNIKNFIYKLRNLHKLFFISKMYNFNPSNNIVLNNGLKKRNFLLKNLHKILKNKSSLIKKINYISSKGLRILKKARKNKNFLLKTLK